jgi:dTDP-4-amino-4,6-dideoxygalactose transaminase
MTWKIPLSDLAYGPEEEAAAQRVIRAGWLSMGEETQGFEREFAQYLGIKHAIACSSGTAALHMALLAVGIGAGDRVLQPAVNFVAAANMTVACGAIPVFADICALDEPTISPAGLEKTLDSMARQGGNRPAAVIVMHYGGYPCRMEAIQQLCREHGIVMIEDACHAPGGRYPVNARGTHRNLGTLGEIGCFSFFSNKNLATGEGGMVVTDRDDLAERVRLLRSHGMTTLTWDRHRGHAASYDVKCHGYNYRIDEIRSAIGREQLKKLEAGNQRRRELTRHYWRVLAPLADRGWVLPFSTQAESESLNHSACHLITLVAPDKESRWRAAEDLRGAGIQTSLHYPLAPGFAAFAVYREQVPLPLATHFCHRTLTLPLHPGLTEQVVTSVAEILLNH